MTNMQPWHALDAPAAVARLGTHAEHGLDAKEADRRRAEHGPNAISVQRGPGPVRRFVAQFHQPLVYVLLVAGTVTAVLGEWVDSGVIFGVVLVNAMIGFIQESKAVDAIERLAKTMVGEAVLLRSGKRQRMSADQLVVGDIVLLQPGDRVPADLRVLRAKDLRVDESALTGESVPADKQVRPVASEAVLGDRKCMLYGSTLVAAGRGAGAVVAIGMSTEVGRISRMIAQAERLETPLTRKISAFARILVWIILALAALTFAIGLARGQDALDMFMAAVALAVGAIPEGLPAAVTIILAIGVSRMAARRAIIRRLPAVETLGSTTVICSDKTGTLTENQMTVQELATADGSYRVSGTGYEPTGRVSADGNAPEVVASAALRRCCVAAALCNESRIVRDEGRWTVEGDPTEGALVVLARKLGLAEDELEAELPRLDTVPFESAHRYMATLHAAGSDRVVFVKGALETLLPRCTSALDAGGRNVAFDADKVRLQAERAARRGLRVIAVAEKYLPASHSDVSHDDVRGELTFLGMVGMLDPPRPEAITAVAACRRAGVAVKMITGDHVGTATAIAIELGLDGGRPRALSGQELDRLDEEELKRAVGSVAVFARVSPEQKLRLVRALQARGDVVAMTGDGVNDAPALRQADIGVAMGLGGTEVAKDASDMVLTDDNFANIQAAVEEGRGVFDNLTKFIVWTLPTNFGEGLVVLAAVVTGAALPILPVQILWINMTTAILLGMTLAFEPKEADVMSRPPRKPYAPIMTRALLLRTALVAMIMLIAAFGLYELELWRGGSQAQARTAAINVFVMIEMFYLLSCRSLTRSIFSVGLTTNRWVIFGIVAMLGLQLVLTYSTWMNAVFHTAPIDPATWGLVVLSGAVAFAAVSIEKWLRRQAKAQRLMTRRVTSN
jgi:cation-transporting P-type ATPase F